MASGKPARPLRYSALIDGDRVCDLAVDRLPDVVTQGGIVLSSSANMCGHLGSDIAVALEKPHRGVRPRTSPRGRELGDLRALHPQRLLDRVQRGTERADVVVEYPQVKPGLGVVPVPDL